MLSRNALHTLGLFSCPKENTEGNFFNQLPQEVLVYLQDIAIDMKPNPDSDIQKALRLADAGEKNDIDALIMMLKTQPRLLLEAGNIFTRNGLDVRRVTVYEFLLGAGDPDTAEKVAPIFEEFDGGKEERAKQYERYRPHIEGMLNQTPYETTWLFDIIKQSSAIDVTAALNHDMAHESVLRDALNKFRDDVKPGVLIKPQMHCNYATIAHVLDMFCKEWLNLYRKGKHYDKCHLVWRQLFGYVQLVGLPTVDRIAFARAFEDKIRTLTCKSQPDLTFPDAPIDGLLTNLGRDFAIYYGSGYWFEVWPYRECWKNFKLHVEQKRQAYKPQTYTATLTSSNSEVRNLLK